MTTMTEVAERVAAAMEIAGVSFADAAASMADGLDALALSFAQAASAFSALSRVTRPAPAVAIDAETFWFRYALARERKARRVRRRR